MIKTSERARVILVAHTGTTFYLIGTVWFAQVVLFPLFAFVSPDDFIPYIEAHARSFGWVIWPALAVNAGTLVAVVARAGAWGLPRRVVGVDLVAFVVTQVSTFALQVPTLIALGEGLQLDLVRSLVATNWMRTTSQTVSGIAAAVLLLHALRRGAHVQAP